MPNDGRAERLFKSVVGTPAGRTIDSFMSDWNSSKRESPYP